MRFVLLMLHCARDTRAFGRAGRCRLTVSALALLAAKFCLRDSPLHVRTNREHPARRPNELTLHRPIRHRSHRTRPPPQLGRRA
jgi:hypothetical protein